MADEVVSAADEETVNRAFGAENRNRLIDKYFHPLGSGSVIPANAWQHVYRLLLWSDPTTGLAHCYESDKSQPGKPWYSRSLAFHDWVSTSLGMAPADLADGIDWLFIKACSDLTAAILRSAARKTEVAAAQRLPYVGRGFPEPGADPELAAIIREAIEPYLREDLPEEAWQLLTQKVRQFLAVQNKRKNLVGEGFEDVLSQIVRRGCNLTKSQVLTRALLFEIPGFNRARTGGKENKVDLAIIRPSMRTIVTAKWSVRADREKQFPAEYEEYCNAEASSKQFEYVFVTNEFDPARLMRACEALYRNSLMFNRVVHISTDAIKAAYGDLSSASVKGDDTRKRVIEHIDNERLISLERWLSDLSLP